MTEIYKNIQCNVTQLATTMTLIDNYIKDQQEMIEIYTDKLNAAYSTDDVTFCQEVIKDKKANIKSMLDLQKQMSTEKLITKHTL